MQTQNQICSNIFPKAKTKKKKQKIYKLVQNLDSLDKLNQM